MRSQPTITIATYALLCLAGGVSFIIPAEIPVSSAVHPATPAPVRAGPPARSAATIDLRIDAGGNTSRASSDQPARVGDRVQPSRTVANDPTRVSAPGDTASDRVLPR